MTHIEAMKLAASVLKGAQEYKRGHTTFVEAVEDIEDTIAEAEQAQSSYVQTIKDQEAVIHRLQKRYAELEATTPPQRKPLTDEEWQFIADTLGCFITRKQKDAIEAAHGIKENT